MRLQARAGAAHREGPITSCTGLSDMYGSLDLPTPVIAIVGEVAALVAKLRWFGPPALPLRAAPRRERVRAAP